MFHQESARVRRGGEHHVGLPIKEGFQGIPEHARGGSGTEKAVGHHFRGEASLIVEEEGETEHAQGKAPLVKEGVYQVGTKTKGFSPHQRGQGQVEHDFLPGGSHLDGPAAKEAGAYSSDGEPLLTRRVGDKTDVMAVLHEGVQVAPDAHVAAVVREERGGGDSKDAEG